MHSGNGQPMHITHTTACQAREQAQEHQGTPSQERPHEMSNTPVHPRITAPHEESIFTWRGTTSWLTHNEAKKQLCLAVRARGPFNAHEFRICRNGWSGRERLLFSAVRKLTLGKV